MADAVYMMNHVQLESGGYEFSAVSSKLSFDGFMSIYNDGEEKAASAPAVDHLSEGMELSVSVKCCCVSFSLTESSMPSLR